MIKRIISDVFFWTLAVLLAPFWILEDFVCSGHEWWLGTAQVRMRRVGRLFWHMTYKFDYWLWRKP